tara:strand:- start:140 stop:370 length:231 start_codon:yes stop_codon:yes gene_type:complete
MKEEQIKEVIELIKTTGNVSYRVTDLVKNIKDRDNRVFYNLDDADANFSFAYEYLFNTLVALCDDDIVKAETLLNK